MGLFRILSVIFAENEAGAGEEVHKVGVVEVLKVDDKLGVRGDVEVSGDFGGGSAVQMGGAVDIEVVVRFGRGSEGRGMVG